MILLQFLIVVQVKDLEGELEVTKQKSKENLQQAIVIERERVTRIQWDMDELRRKYLEMESRLKSEQVDVWQIFFFFNLVYFD